MIAGGGNIILEVFKLHFNDGHDDFFGLLLGSLFRDRCAEGWVLKGKQLVCAAVDDSDKLSDDLAIA